MEDAKLKAVVAATNDIEGMLGMAALMHTGALSDVDFLRASMAAFGKVIGQCGDPARPEEVADTFAGLLRKAILKTMRNRKMQVDYAEFSLKGVLARVMEGIELDGREAEFALGMELVGTDGKPTQAARGFWAEHVAQSKKPT
jgi:hypothetical protein